MLGIALFPATVLTAGLLVVQAVMGKSLESQRWVTHTHQVIAEAHALMSDAVNAAAGERGFLLTGDESMLLPYNASLTGYVARAGRLRTLVADNPDQVKRVARMEQLFARWLSESAAPTIAQYRRSSLQPDGPGLDVGAAVQQGSGGIEDLRTLVHAFVAGEEALLAMRSSRNEQLSGAAGIVSLSAVATAVVLGLGLALGLSRRLSKTLTSVTRAAEALAAGDRTTRAVADGPNLAAGLARSFNQMADALSRREWEADQLSRLGEFLAAARDVAEAARLSSAVLETMFPGATGALYASDAERTRIHPLATWGPGAEMLLAFDPSECWALRHGRIQEGREGQGALGCAHVDGQVHDYLCVPMGAGGEAVSILHLRPAAGQPPLVRGALGTRLGAVAERIAVALANLRLKETLRAQSIRDPLTGLFNRRYLEETLVRELSRAERERSTIGVIVVDVDHFKRFNDLHGHQAGDSVLHDVGCALSAGLRRSDVPCRYGGEEFVLILPGASLAQAAERAETLRVAISRLQVSHGGTPLEAITASFGVAAYPEHGDEAKRLVGSADRALYVAKASGRNRVETASHVTPLPPAPIATA